MSVSVSAGDSGVRVRVGVRTRSNRSRGGPAVFLLFASDEAFEAEPFVLLLMAGSGISIRSHCIYCVFTVSVTAVC